MYKLNEDTRKTLINKGKKGANYKGTWAKGKNRYQRRVHSRVLNSVKEFNEIDMNKLFKDNVLSVFVKVHGETDDYLVGISFGGFCEILNDQLKEGEEVSLRHIVKALMIGINKSDVFIRCNCPDFCLLGETQIKLLSGETLPISELCQRFKTDQDIYVYSVDSDGDFKPGRVVDVWQSGYSAELVKVTLDNGESVTTTPNHRYMLRDGSFVAAENLQKGQSLMPLYFKYDNGYESVKMNSRKDATVFRSVYKIVASELLGDDIDSAKVRSGEDIIQIHHKDFNKLNNHPSNLLPMGKLEHWKYHYDHVKDSGCLDRFLSAGRAYWELAESRKKQAELCSAVMRKFYGGLSAEERSAMHCSKGENAERWKSNISAAQRRLWESYSEEEYRNRCKINANTNAQMTTKMKLSEAQKRSYELNPQRKTVSVENLKKAQAKVKGSHFTPEHCKRISESLINRTAEEKQNHIRKINVAKAKRIIDFMLSGGMSLDADTFESVRRTEAQFKHYPRLCTVFESWEDAVECFDLQHEYNHKVVGVERVTLDSTVPVYDISVEGYDNFFVSAGIILHNCYRFGFQDSVHNIIMGQKETRPSNITNPNNTLGSGCKHVLLVLNNTTWVLKCASVINNYINYMKTHYEKLYANVIYPAIYKRKYEEPVQTNLDDTEDDELATSEQDIDVSNEYGRTRTQFKKGNKQGIRFAKSKKDPDQIDLIIDDEEE